MSSRIGDNLPKSVQDLRDRAGKLPTGVEGTNVPSDFSIPPAVIEDVDRAIFNLFEKRLRLEIVANKQTIPVPTVFAGGERVFLAKRNRPPRDKAGAFILPIVSIRRSGIEQSKPGVIPGRGMGQNTGDLVIRRRLSSRDPQYQSLLNKLRLQNQANVASANNQARPGQQPMGSLPGTVATRRLQPISINTLTGDLLSPDLGKNIFEIITMPFPHFYTALYEVTIWTQYIQHMNGLLERFMTSYDAQGNQFRLDTDKGYWFVAYVDDDINSDDNFSDYTDDERFVKYKFTIKVPAYLHGKERFGSGVPFRSFLSAPQISFELIGGAIPANQPVGAPVGSGDINKFTLSDVQPLDKRGDAVEDERQEVDKVPDLIQDPFTGKGQVRYRRILSRNQRKGETVMSKRVAQVFDDINF